MPHDAAKRFGRSAPLDAAAAEHAGLRVKETEGVACPPWWLPTFMADYGQVHSDTQVLVHDGIDDGKPHRDFMSDQSAEQLTPPDSPSHAHSCAESSNSVRPRYSIAEGAETLNLWTSSALLCAFILLFSVYAFDGKVSTLLSSCTQRAPFFFAAASATCTLLAAPCTPCTSCRSRAHPSRVEFRTTHVRRGRACLLFWSTL